MCSNSDRPHEAAFDPDVAELPLEVLLDRVVDPLIAFNLANPAAHVLLNSADVSPTVAASTRRLHEAVLQRIEAIVGARAFGLPPGQRARVARVIFQVFKGLLSLVLSSQGRERAALVRELKTVLRRYLEPIDRLDRRR